MSVGKMYFDKKMSFDLKPFNQRISGQHSYDRVIWPTVNSLTRVVKTRFELNLISIGKTKLKWFQSFKSVSNRLAKNNEMTKTVEPLWLGRRDQEIKNKKSRGLLPSPGKLNEATSLKEI
jgi:hypothetical protein